MMGVLCLCETPARAKIDHIQLHVQWPGLEHREALGSIERVDRIIAAPRRDRCLPERHSFLTASGFARIPADVIGFVSQFFFIDIGSLRSSTLGRRSSCADDGRVGPRRQLP
jgi:hypothetical protein